MKKTSLWLMISTLVLCMGVMITGVYSALTANLNINGSLGFNMHNATVTVQGSIQNVAETTDNWSTATSVTKTIERTIMGGEEQTTTNISLVDLYFYTGSNMIFTFTFTNISETAIQATFPLPTVGSGVTILTGTSNGYTEFTDGEYTTTIVVDASTTVSFALTMENGTLGENILFNWSNIVFEETIIPPGYTVTINCSGKYYYVERQWMGYIINDGDAVLFSSMSFELKDVYKLQFVLIEGSYSNPSLYYTISVSILSTPNIFNGSLYYNGTDSMTIDSTDVINITQNIEFTLNIDTDPSMT